MPVLLFVLHHITARWAFHLVFSGIAKTWCESYDWQKLKGDWRSSVFILRLLVVRENSLLTLNKGTLREVEIDYSYFCCMKCEAYVRFKQQKLEKADLPTIWISLRLHVCAWKPLCYIFRLNQVLCDLESWGNFHLWECSRNTSIQIYYQRQGK